MIESNDIIHVKNENSWVNNGIKYAEKSLNSTFNRMASPNPYKRMRRIIKGILSELAFENILSSKKIAFDTKGRTRWYEIDRYDIALKSRKCDLKSFFLDLDLDYLKNKKILDLKPSSSEWLLDCSALVPSDQLYQRKFQEKDLYLFAFISGRIRPSLTDRMMRDNLDKYIIHSFWDYSWIKPQKWIKKHGKSKLGIIKISSNNSQDQGKKITIGGTIDHRKFMFEEVELVNNPPRAITKNNFFQLYYLQLPDGIIPKGTLTITASSNNTKEIVYPDFGFRAIKLATREYVIDFNNWNNIWIYDSESYFVGYMEKGEFKKKSTEIKRFYKDCKQYRDTLTDNNMIIVQDLHPLSNIIV